MTDLYMVVSLYMKNDHNNLKHKTNKSQQSHHTLIYFLPQRHIHFHPLLVISSHMYFFSVTCTHFEISNQ